MVPPTTQNDILLSTWKSSVVMQSGKRTKWSLENEFLPVARGVLPACSARETWL